MHLLTRSERTSSRCFPFLLLIWQWRCLQLPQQLPRTRHGPQHRTRRVGEQLKQVQAWVPLPLHGCICLAYFRARLISFLVVFSIVVVWWIHKSLNWAQKSPRNQIRFQFPFHWKFSDNLRLKPVYFGTAYIRTPEHKNVNTQLHSQAAGLCIELE